MQGVQYCNQLFAIEDSINKRYNGDYEKRKQLRLEKEKPVLEAFWSWLDQQKPVRNTRLDKAVNYVLNRRDIAETYLEDGRCSFTNNLSENAIRPFAVGRKNWLFSDAPRGARASAAIYSVTTTAKANGLNPRLYVEWLLTEMPNAGELTDEVVDSFLPWSDRVPESCKLDPAAAEKAKEMPDDFIINIDPDAFDDEMANNAEEGL